LTYAAISSQPNCHPRDTVRVAAALKAGQQTA